MVSNALDFLYSLQKLGSKLGLETTERIMDALGNPQKALKVIHVAGTNGKGSTCAYISSILMEAGYSVGLYTSPHLVTFNERIQIDGRKISDEELSSLTEIVRGKINGLGLSPTFFEFTTAIAFLFFLRNSVDFAVVEVGLGGRLDATNVVAPLISVITGISIDHSEQLGSTQREIAYEKAGIIKKGVPVVVNAYGEALEVFKAACSERRSEIFAVRELLSAKRLAQNVESQNFSVSGAVNGSFEISLLGDHQITNACTALLTIQILKNKLNLQLSDDSIKKGLIKASWPGRIQIISIEPFIILDCAHNVEGVSALCAFLRKFNHKKTLLTGFSNDKDARAMLAMFKPLFNSIILTESSFKPMPVDRLVEMIRNYSGNLRKIPVAGDAINEALVSVNKDEMLVIAGSIYLVGDIMKILVDKNILFKTPYLKKIPESLQ